MVSAAPGFLGWDREELDGRQPVFGMELEGLAAVWVGGPRQQPKSIGIDLVLAMAVGGGRQLVGRLGHIATGKSGVADCRDIDGRREMACANSPRRDPSFKLELKYPFCSPHNTRGRTSGGISTCRTHMEMTGSIYGPQRCSPNP